MIQLHLRLCLIVHTQVCGQSFRIELPGGKPDVFLFVIRRRNRNDGTGRSSDIQSNIRHELRTIVCEINLKCKVRIAGPIPINRHFRLGILEVELYDVLTKIQRRRRMGRIDHSDRLHFDGAPIISHHLRFGLYRSILRSLDQSIDGMFGKIVGIIKFALHHPSTICQCGSLTDKHIIIIYLDG